MLSESGSTSTLETNDARDSKGKGPAHQESTSEDEGEGTESGDAPTSEDHFPKQFTEKDLSIRMALRQAGYDVSKLKAGAELDEAARELLKAKTTSTRIVTRSWPRDPNGQYITPENTQPGKTTSNGVQLWGATIYDFFRVRRIPSLAGLSTLTTGSKLAAWMKKHGEAEFAADEIAWTELEEDPREVPPCDIAGLIDPTDMRSASGLWGKSMPSKDVKATGEASKSTDETDEKGEIISNEEVDEEGEEVDEEKKERAKIGEADDENEGNGKGRTLFDASSYPAPWPLIPFSYPAPTLQNYIPFNRLPKKLIVHDPWNLLSARDYYKSRHDEAEIGDWTKIPDITHVYELTLSPDAIKRIEAEAAETAREKRELEKKLEFQGPYGEYDGFLIRPTEAETGPIEPPIYVLHPAPPPPEPVEEAHLYISPVHSAGRGNHSIVYKAEWEVPRSMLMRHTLCRECIMKDVEEILKEEDGEDGSKKEARWKEKRAKLEQVLHVEPALSVSLVPENEDFVTKEGKTTRKDINKDGDVYNFHPGDAYSKMEFEGPVRPIKTRIPWVSPGAPHESLCSHTAPSRPYPPTTKVTVMAKLSLQHDKHLAVEARNYQKFPKHFFEHWNGLNLLPPLHDPTPVGAVVPQFYGHYVPIESNESMKQTDTDASSSATSFSSKRKPYLSPIMLLENCGVPLNPNDLNIDEKNECASLYYRFHHAGWVHRSIAQRNILVQLGPLTLPPFYRPFGAPEGQRHSFRLIDFGRSCPMEHGNAGAMEEMEVANLFGHMEI